MLDDFWTGWQKLIALTVATVIEGCLEKEDKIAAAFRRGMTATAVDSKPDPQLKSEVDQAIADARARGEVP